MSFLTSLVRRICKILHSNRFRAFEIRVVFLLLAAAIFASAAVNSAGVASKLAEKADQSRANGEIVRAFLLYTEAASRDLENPAYRAKRDSIAAAAQLLMRTKLETADITGDVVDAERVSKEEIEKPAGLTTEAANVQPTPKWAPMQPTVPWVDSAVIPGPKNRTVPANLSLGLSFRQDTAITAVSPVHLMENRSYAYLDINSDLWISASEKYRLQVSEQLRAYYDSVFGLTSFYPSNVRNQQEYQVQMRRLVVTLSAPGWTVHVGRQQVAWGQALGVFIADVVNPKDYTLFLTQDFDDIRIPLWSLDVQRKLGKNRTLELFWSPDVRQSTLPVAGSPFAFFSPASSLPVETSYSKPARNFANSTAGIRYSWLKNGWDSSVFYLRSLDDLPALTTALQFNPGPFVSLSRQFPELNRFAASTSKPVGDFVFRSEAIYTQGQAFQTRALGPALSRDSVSGMIGLSHSLWNQYALDLQYFQTSLLGGGSRLYEPGFRSGVSMRIGDVASLRRVKPSIQAIISPNQHDYWITPKITVRVAGTLFATVGMNWFGGGPETQFGQFHKASQIQTSLFWKAKSY